MAPLVGRQRHVQHRTRATVPHDVEGTRDFSVRRRKDDRPHLPESGHRLYFGDPHVHSRLSCDLDGEPDELYNLIDDPRERSNLIDRHPEEAQRLARAFGSVYQSGAAQVEVKGIQGKYELASSGIA